MKNIKKQIIRYTWKNGWFRAFVILIPTWIIPLTFICIKCNIFEYITVDTYTSILSFVYLLTIAIAILDNEGVDEQY